MTCSSISLIGTDSTVQLTKIGDGISNAGGTNSSTFAESGATLSFPRQPAWTYISFALMVSLSNTCSHTRHPCLFWSATLHSQIKYPPRMRRALSLRSSSVNACVVFMSLHRPRFCAAYSKSWTASFQSWKGCSSICRQKAEQAWGCQRNCWHHFCATSHYLTSLFQYNLSYSDKPRASSRSDSGTSRPPSSSILRTWLHNSTAWPVLKC